MFAVTARVMSLQTATSSLQHLNGVGGGDLVKGGSGVFGAVTVHLHEFHQVELGLLQHLHLADEHVLQGEDRLALLLNLHANRIRRGDAGIEIRRREREK